METTSIESSQPPHFTSTDEDNHHDNLVPDLANHGVVEPKRDITEDEVRGILEVIAATGKFWHDWDILKSLLSIQLKQVLGEYSEAKMASDQQNSSLGETFPELQKRLDEALLSFTEGPPFTLQRLCEILLTARSIYPNLSKLALALEKNLLVTSMLPICTDPYPSTMTQQLDEPDKVSEGLLDEPDKVSGELQVNSDPIQNGAEAIVGDGDEEMIEAEEVEEENKSTEMETMEETISVATETNSESGTNSEPSGEPSPSSEQLNTTSS